MNELERQHPATGMRPNADRPRRQAARCRMARDSALVQLRSAREHLEDCAVWGGPEAVEGLLAALLGVGSSIASLEARL